MEIALEDLGGRRYRKLVINQGQIVGGILLEYSLEASALTTAVKQNLEVSNHLAALRAVQCDLLHE